jgi:hypothetical protein
VVQLPFRIHGEGHESAFEYKVLFDCGATATFGSKPLFVDKLGFKPSARCVTVKNDDGSYFFDFVIGLDMIRAYKMELSFVQGFFKLLRTPNIVL